MRIDWKALLVTLIGSICGTCLFGVVCRLLGEKFGYGRIHDRMLRMVHHYFDHQLLQERQ